MFLDENGSFPLEVRGLTKTSSSRLLSIVRARGADEADTRHDSGCDCDDGPGRLMSDSEKGRSANKNKVN